jgi:histidyl-tRNA synthetase
MKKIIQPVKGTRDFYPDRMAIRNWLYQKVRKVSESFGYQEYDGPFLERIDLYAAKSGEEIVKEQAFVFQDRGGDHISLRPELTPTLARMVAQRQNELALPLRWWSFGPFWRYERPQKGRTREFFQWNIDLIGTNTPEADAELIAVSALFFENVGLTSSQVGILVNDRHLMETLFQELGINAHQNKSAFHLIDRVDKLSGAEWEAFALESGIQQNQYSGLRDMLNDHDLWNKSHQLRRVFDAVDAMGVRDYVHFDPKIVRGLDYYTTTVFEGRSLEGEGRALLGGGHYDNLVNDVGGSPLPGVGFAMGDVMITLLLEQYGLCPKFCEGIAPIFITVFDETRLKDSFALAAEIRQTGQKIYCYPEAAKLQKQLKLADRMGTRFVIILGPDEEEKGVVTLKDLVNHNQQTIARGEVGRYLVSQLGV